MASKTTIYRCELCAPLCGNTKGVPRWDGACFISNLDKDFNGLYYGDTSPMLGSWRKPWEAAPLSDREKHGENLWIRDPVGIGGA